MSLQTISIFLSIFAVAIATWSAFVARSSFEAHWRPYVIVRWADREDGTWLEVRNEGRSSAYSITVALGTEMPWAEIKENPFRYLDVLHPGESRLERLEGSQTRRERLYGEYGGRIGWEVTLRYRGERDILPRWLRWKPRTIVTGLDADLNSRMVAKRKGREYLHTYQIKF